MLDFHLAALYGVETKNLNKAVKRNFDRFPADFMFQLEVQEVENLRFQIGTSSLGHGGRRYLPFGNLDSSEVITYITDIMEGGREAFQYRQTIYQSHWDSPVEKNGR